LKNTCTAALCLSLALLTASQAAANTITVNAGGNLQAAIDAARPGDTILLQAGATFTGAFKLGNKGGTKYITIRSSAPDASLPAPGERINPSFASLLPKIKATPNGAALRVSPGATYWRLLFLEFLPASSTASANLVEFGGAGTNQSSLSSAPHDLIMDRCYLHGDPVYGQRRGLALNSGKAYVVNSHFSDFKGINQDTQAINGWNGPGPFLIENNHLEAAGENVMFGGTDPSIPNLVPTDITIRKNLFTQPTAWMTKTWTVKNLLEFKNARNVLVEGNIIENNWASGQQGYSILFTPRNQSGTAPSTVVRDVVVQNNVIRHVAAAFNVNGYDNLALSQQTQNIAIRNNLLYDVNTKWATPNNPAPGRLAIVGGGPKNITFDHNTVDNNGSSTIFIYGGYTLTGTTIVGFEVTNNLLRDNNYGIYGDRYGEGLAALKAYSPNGVVLRNTLAGGSAKVYPTGNDFPTLTQWLADFVNVAEADYHLVPGSLSRGSGTDGKDLGVNFAELDAALNAPPTPLPDTSGPPFPPGGGTTGESTPYTGTAVALPGMVEFEKYDNGGSAVAYADTTSGNSGNAYRSDNVDIQATTDAGGGYNLGWVKATEWLNYTVTVGTANTYAIDVRVASNGAGGVFHIEVDGNDATGAMTVPNTGGFQIWRTITAAGVSLTAGPHVIRVVMDSVGPITGSVGNFNWFEVR
jgi:carbohydrate binding protein with CBM6 domain